jgi:general stress protein YciG
MGGRAAWAKGVAHKWTAEEAVAAAKIGGKVHSREHMAEIGRIGRKAKGAKIKAAE